MSSYTTEKTPNVRVTLLEDPNNSLQELFNPISQRQQVPLHQRKLPKSFFVPPAGFKEQTHLTELPSTDFVISHSKANSSPACLDAPSYVSVEPCIGSHAHQKSLDVGGDYPHGFCHNINLGDILSGNFIQHTRDSQSSPYTCRPVLNYVVSELPGWYEMTLNDNNQVYFLNHKTKVTTWFDPRIPEEHQKWGMSLDELQQVHINYARQLYGNMQASEAYRNQPDPVVCSSNLGQQGLLDSPSVRSPNQMVTSTSTRQNASPALRQQQQHHNTQSAIPGLSPSSVANSQTAQTNLANATAALRSRLPVQAATSTGSPNRSHPPKGPSAHTQSVQMEHNLLTDVNHQRHQSHPHHQEAVSLFGNHSRSCSQPVPMSISREGKPLIANRTTPNAPDSTRADSLAHLGLINGNVCGLSASSSLIGLSIASGMTAQQLLGQQVQLGSTTTSSSSGQLVQGLECLRLNTSPAATNLATAAHLLEQQQSQQQQQQSSRLQQQQYILPVNTNSTMSQQQQQLRFAGGQMHTATQHSHQGSTDSGVGPSLTGQSSASANQTPEHTVMLLCDPNSNRCTNENMEGISYPNEEMTCAPLNMFDNIDISDISA